MSALRQGPSDDWTRDTQGADRVARDSEAHLIDRQVPEADDLAELRSLVYGNRRSAS